MPYSLSIFEMKDVFRLGLHDTTTERIPTEKVLGSTCSKTAGEQEIIHMKKQTELEKYQGYIVENGIAHIMYRVSDINDIIHPLSIKGYEMLSDDFIGFLEKYRVIIPPKVPVVLEISGKPLEDAEKELIDNTIWSNFCMNMTSADMEARACIKRVVTFLLYTVLSVVLLFAVKDVSEELITNLAYLPFWFFGYRLLIYLILDCMPLWKQRKWYRQLASMSVIFPDDDVRSIENIPAKEIAEKISEYLNATDEKLKNNRMALQYIKEKRIVELGCRASSLEELVQTPQLKDREFMSSGLAAYLGQAEPFLSPDCRITFEIQGKAFSDEEQGIIKQAVKNYYGFRIASEERGILDNKRKILLFSLLIFVSAVIVVLWGAKADVAMHEFIIMLFWFFGDYLLEFILITHFGFKRSKKILKNCRDMEIMFSPAQK